MKKNPVILWVISAVAILALVIGGYTLYDNNTTQNHAEEAEQAPGGHGGHDNNGGQTAPAGGQVTSSLAYQNGLFEISVTDKSGKPVEDFEINHEKLNHFIVVSDDQSHYYHLHPEYKGVGKFEMAFQLSQGAYKAFVDIKPKGYDYVVSSLPVQVGEATDHGHHAGLVPETNFTKTIDQHTVTMKPSTLKSGEEVMLDFQIAEGTPEPYLGALGHVVILDEQAEKYVHVHPESDVKTVFATHFEQPGIYKIWAEFKFNGKVTTFPFVVEVK